MRKAAAVVIGVDRTGGLDPLQSAAAGAQEVATWLEAEGFQVTCLTDGPAKAVMSQDVFNAIAGFATKPATYDFLLVYFSGHGQWHTRADHWLLSGAPANTAEAVNLEGAMGTAAQSGIPNVVFISDACRTIPKTEADSRVAGVDAFPNHSVSPKSKVDYFRATSEARPAYEIPIGGMTRSVLTHAILSAFKAPEPQIVLEIVDGVERFSVVPNRRLELVLQSRVDAILDGVAGGPTQDVDISVPSADTVYIARVRPGAGGDAAPKPPAPRKRPGFAAPSDPGAVMGFQVIRPIEDEIERSAPKPPRRKPPANPVDRRPRVSEADIAARIPDPAAAHFETETGFIVRGARVANAVISPRANSNVDVLNMANDPRGDAVRIYPGVSALPVVVGLADGRCTVLPALRGYLGHALFDETGLANVSYVPSSNNWRWGAYDARRGEIDQLRARVALAVDHNVFRVQSDAEAAAFAEAIRVEKAYDPTLGLYAAYAFAQAGIDNQVRSVAGYMRDDLRADFFDVWMLAGGAVSSASAAPRASFCPMLTQGWNLVRAYGVQLPDSLAEAALFLTNSLWTTFTPRGSAIVANAVLSGELQ